MNSCPERTVALVLNNIGVSLLERGHYHEARQTFNDAVQILTKFFGSKKTTTNMAPAQISRRLRDAEMRQARSRGKRAVPGLVTTITDHDGLETLLSEYQRNTVAQRQMYAVRIDKSQAARDDEDDEDNVAIESSIILCNYAVSQRCIAFIVGDDGVEYLGNAAQLFQLSYAALSARQAKAVNSIQWGPSLLSGAVCLHGLILIANQFGQSPREYEHRLTGIMEAVVEMQRAELVQTVRGVAAAA